jgi:hypothetical protein
LLKTPRLWYFVMTTHIKTQPLPNPKGLGLWPYWFLPVSYASTPTSMVPSVLILPGNSPHSQSPNSLPPSSCSLTELSWLVWAAITNDGKPCGLDNRHLFSHSSVSWKSELECRMVGLWWGPTSRLQATTVSLDPPMVGRELVSSLASSHKGSNSHCEGPTLVT